jgi:hypothetical protein
MRYVHAAPRESSPNAERLNRQVLRVLEELKTDVATDPGVIDEYAEEIFGEKRTKKKMKK